MGEHSGEILEAIREVRELLRLLAEPAIAQRDEKFRNELRRIVGASPQRMKSVLGMDGTKTQKAICQETGMSSGNMSTLVKNLSTAKLLVSDPKQPKLAISIPPNFFEGGGKFDG